LRGNAVGASAQAAKSLQGFYKLGTNRGGNYSKVFLRQNV
jgi:hypothetical protein